MDSSNNNFKQQTLAIIDCLFQDEDVYECDGLEDSEHDDFNPVKIAAKLRELGDHYDETVIKPLIKDVQDAAADQVVSVFGKSVNALCKMWAAERPEIVPEKEILKATVALALYVKNNCPDMTSTIRAATFSIFNNQIGSWITQQGGWEQASCL
ncbi:bcl-2-like protein 15 [Brachyhypopomus gauderio]|uniref:bcl-2-like protein 15 n=1 Tax=Brachyhypopomus gauderio TaxID=698409 RepID=UPI00404253A3